MTVHFKLSLWIWIHRAHSSQVCSSVWSMVLYRNQLHLWLQQEKCKTAYNWKVSKGSITYQELQHIAAILEWRWPISILGFNWRLDGFVCRKLYCSTQPALGRNTMSFNRLGCERHVFSTKTLFLCPKNSGDDAARLCWFYAACSLYSEQLLVLKTFQ